MVDAVTKAVAVCPEGKEKSVGCGISKGNRLMSSSKGLGRATIPLLASIGELLVRAFAAIYLAVKFGYVGMFFSGPIAWVTAALVLAGGYYTNIHRFIKEAI